MTEPAHSKLLAPSSSHRWMHCTASPHAAQHYKDEPGEAAMEGTAAHWLLEQCLVDGSDPAALVGRTLTVVQDHITREFVISQEMASNVLHCGISPVREIAQRPGMSRVEVKAQLGYIDPELFGRTDVWHFGSDRWLTVFDFKYGRVDVSPERNEQLMIYALGIYREHVAPIVGEDVAGVNLIIGQPRSLLPGPRIKTWQCSLVDLLDFELELRVAVNGVRHRPEFKMGSWCGYCPALGACPLSQEAAVNIGPILAQTDLTPLEASRVLTLKKLLEKKIKDAAAVGKDALMRRQDVPGFKLVTGAKHRRWRDEDQAKDALIEAVGISALKIPTPAQTEALGPDAAAVVDRLSFLPPGEPEIAASDDKRSAFVAKSASEMFKGT